MGDTVIVDIRVGSTGDDDRFRAEVSRRIIISNSREISAFSSLRHELHLMLDRAIDDIKRTMELNENEHN